MHIIAKERLLYKKVYLCKRACARICLHYTMENYTCELVNAMAPVVLVINRELKLTLVKSRVLLDYKLTHARI